MSYINILDFFSKKKCDVGSMDNICNDFFQQNAIFSDNFIFNTLDKLQNEDIIHSEVGWTWVMPICA